MIWGFFFFFFCRWQRQKSTPNELYLIQCDAFNFGNCVALTKFFDFFYVLFFDLRNCFTFCQNLIEFRDQTIVSLINNVIELLLSDCDSVSRENKFTIKTVGRNNNLFVFVWCDVTWGDQERQQRPRRRSNGEKPNVEVVQVTRKRYDFWLWQMKCF